MRGFIVSFIILFMISCTSNIEVMHDKQVEDFIEKETKIVEVKTMKELIITSPEFKHESEIPKKFTCDGEDINPEINIKGIPDGAKSLVLINDDPDAPVGTWDHWVVWDIPITEKIDEDSIPGTQGKNSWGRNDYGGPCPPSGTHRYFFKVYVLNKHLELDQRSTKNDVIDAMQNFVIAKGELVGLYKRN